MKFYLLFVAVILGVNAIDEEFIKQTRARVRKIAEDCVVEEHAQMSDLETIIDLKIPETHEGRCLLFCTHKKFNMQNPDGSINRQGALDTLEIVKDVDIDFYNRVVKALDHCIDTPIDPDPCKYAAALSICFLAKAKEEGVHELLIE